MPPKPTIDLQSNIQSYTFDTLPPRKSEFTGTSGIYGIHCIPSDKWYIGETTDLRGRLHTGHRISLRKNRHHNSYLQRAYNKYGKNAFEVHIFEKCDKNSLETREQYYIDLYKSKTRKNIYNLRYLGDDKILKFARPFSERSPVQKNFKIRLSDAKVIRELYAEGYLPTVIGGIYKLTRGHVSKILANEIWTDPEYIRPQKIPNLTLAQRNKIDQLLVEGVRAQDMPKIVGAYYHRVSKYLKDSARSTFSKYFHTILDTETGIFYRSLSEAAKAKELKRHVLAAWLIYHPHRNKSGFVLC